jgi:hypothetical protein
MRLVIARSGGDEAIQPFLQVWIASLAMTVSKLQPVEPARPCAQPIIERRAPSHARNFGYYEIDVKPNFGKSELLSFLKFRNMAICWMSK